MKKSGHTDFIVIIKELLRLLIVPNCLKNNLSIQITYNSNMSKLTIAKQLWMAGRKDRP